eukprot:TRINITY_DN9335_c0_g1_i12.p1 TRINITY_DN9335_c0_g1~~TRINITY_DN9335_c0_g1_i12.p1  ORF type:complete len:450 (-),score=110.23 TRINITY_DN9335_c0_g1_i12:326-1675(-)
MGNKYSSTTVIGGTCHEDFASVKEMFVKNFKTGKERDAQLCVYVDGHKVVDLWGSAEGDESYNGDSLQCVFSSSKAITAIAVATLADQGLINYSNPVSTYIPEFASKPDVKVEDVLRHESGLANLHVGIEPTHLLKDHLHKGTVASLIANNKQTFPDSTPREYHNLTGGWIINEVVRKATPDNVTLGTYIRREFYKKHNVDVHLGLTKEELARTHPLKAMTVTKAVLQSLIPNAFGGEVEHNIFVFGKILNSFKKKFMEVEKRGFAPMFAGQSQQGDPGKSIPEFFNSSVWREGESPAGSVHASARALAKLAAAMSMGGKVEGGEVITPGAWSLLHANPVCRPDAQFGMARTEFTQGGVNMYKDYEDDTMKERLMKSGRDGFVGWKGMGGSVIQWHPKLQIGFGYACTFLTWWDMVNTKARKMQKEVKSCVQRAKEKNTDVNNNEPTTS